jgi:hypothetical protein
MARRRPASSWLQPQEPRARFTLGRLSTGPLVSSNWTTINIVDASQAEDELAILAGSRWLCRGQDEDYGALIPSIDRGGLKNLPRLAKLRLERQSIDLFRLTANYLGPGEEPALVDDNVALAVLRHYGVPTRLLDWSISPHVAAYFAACGPAGKSGEVWAFDQHLYEERGRKQWVTHPETTLEGDGETFVAGLTAFSDKAPYDWFCCMFYPSGFVRQNRQKGLYSITRKFGIDHASAIAQLLGGRANLRRYIVKPTVKRALLKNLRENHGIWRGSLFPDSMGAAETVQRDVFGVLGSGERALRRSVSNEAILKVLSRKQRHE